MRLQLTLAALLTAPAHAEDTVSTRVDVYHDGWITVVMPSLGASVEREAFTVAASGLLDHVAGATPTLYADEVTSATRFDDLRYGGDLTASWHPKTTWSVGALLSGSRESDFSSTLGGLTWSADMAQRRFTLSGTASFGHEEAWRSSGGDFRVEAYAGQLDLTGTVVIDRSTTLAVLLTGRTEQCSAQIGCAASPYRYVAARLDDAWIASHERHPADRWRLAGSLKLARMLGDTTALHLAYRYYVDTWQVQGHSGRVAVTTELAQERLMLRGELRAGWSSAASFYEDTYVTSSLTPAWSAFRTADPELTGVVDVMLEGQLRWSFFQVAPLTRLSVQLRGAGLWFRYPQLSELPSRDGLLVGGGLGVTF